MKTLILIMLIPTLALAWELPPGLELVSIDGDHVTVKDNRTGLMDIYLIEGEPIINGWALDPNNDSLVFQLVADLNMYLVSELQSHDFLGDGFIELIGTDLLSNSEVLFLENSGNFNFIEVNRIESENLLYDFGNGDDDDLFEILTKYDRSMFIYEQTDFNTYADSLVWQITPLNGNYRVWPKYTDLDGDDNFEVSHNNSNSSYYFIAVNENTGDNIYGNFTEIPWPFGSPGDFAWGDFDGDGFVEIAGGSGAGYLSVFENVADDSFHIVWQEPFGHPNLTIHKFLGDMDGNGFSEWLSGSHDFSHGGFFFKVFEAIGDNQYEVIYYDSLPGNPWFLGGADAGDVDGDGINEFIFSSNTNVGLYKYSTLAGWGRVWLLDSLQGTSTPYLVEVNGDQLYEIVISSDEIPGSTYIYRLIRTGVDEPESRHPMSLNIFPNPANDQIIIYISSPSNKKVSLNIFDITGRKIYSREDLNSDGETCWNLRNNNGRRVGSGIYFVSISCFDFEIARKITILR